MRRRRAVDARTARGLLRRGRGRFALFVYFAPGRGGTAGVAARARDAGRARQISRRLVAALGNGPSRGLAGAAAPALRTLVAAGGPERRGARSVSARQCARGRLRARDRSSLRHRRPAGSALARRTPAVPTLGRRKVLRSRPRSRGLDGLRRVIWGHPPGTPSQGCPTRVSPKGVPEGCPYFPRPCGTAAAGSFSLSY